MGLEIWVMYYMKVPTLIEKQWSVCASFSSCLIIGMDTSCAAPGPDKISLSHPSSELCNMPTHTHTPRQCGDAGV